MRRSAGSTGAGPVPAAPRGGAPGWLPDPAGRAALRYWTGAAWSSWLSDGGPVWSDAPRPVMSEDLEHLRFVEEVFVPHAIAAGIVDGAGQGRLTELAREMAAGARSVRGTEAVPETSRSGPVDPDGVAEAPVLARAAAPASGPGPAAAGSARRPPTWVAPGLGTGTPDAPVRRTPPGRRPGDGTPPVAGPAHGGLEEPAVRRPVPAAGPRGAPAASVARAAVHGWWTRWTPVGVDPAVHGLAYLGVVLLFVGVFGLVAFAFADVAPDLRPLAEIVAAGAPFAAARLLLSRGAVVVARALGVVGGLLVPIMVVTSLVDGAPFPPDPGGPLRAASMSIACAAVAALFAWRTRRRPDTSVRYAAAPALWLSAAMAVLAVGRPVPDGSEVAVPTAVQVTAMSLVLTGCVVVARRRRRSVLGGATLSAATVALPVVVVLAVLTWVAEGAPPTPVLATGVLVLAAAHLLPSVPARFLDVAGPVWWSGVTLGVVMQLSMGVVVALAVAGFIGLGEVAVRRGRGVGALAWSLAGLAVWLGVGLLGTSGRSDAGSWWVVAAFGAVTAWSVARRTVRAGGQAGLPLQVLAAGAPAGLAISVGAARGGVGAGLVVAVLLVGLATVPASLPVLRRDRHDGFWTSWWRSAVVVTAVAAMVVWYAPGSGGRPHAASTLALLAVLVAAGPVRSVLRPPAVAVLGVAGWLMLCDVVAASPWLTAGALAAAGGVVVVLGLSRPSSAASRPAQVLTGHGVGLVALTAGGTGWPPTVACALATAAWAATAVVDEAGRPALAPVVGLSARVARYLPWAVTAVGIPATAVLGLHAADVVGPGDPWAGAILSATAVLYAAAARSMARRRPRTTAVWGAVLAAGAGLLVAAGWAPALAGSEGGWPLAATLAAVCVAAPLLPPPRPAVATWSAWAALAPLAGLLAWLTWPSVAARGPDTVAAVSLTLVGAALLVGAAAADLHGRRWTPRAVPVRRALWAPALVGAVQLGAGLFVGYGLHAPARILQVLALVAGLALLAVGALARAGAPGGLGAVLTWLGVLGLGGEALWRHPWPTLLAAVALLGSAEAASRVGRERRWWARWDTAWLVAAAPVAATTVLADARYGSVVLVVAGLLCVAVAVRLRRQPVAAEVVAWSGTGLLLLGAAEAGPGWPAVAFAALSAGQAVLAARTRGPARTARQVVAVAAALAGWFAGLAWLGWSPQTRLHLTAAAGGLLAVATAAVVRRGRPDRSWALAWGAAGVAMVAGVEVGADLGAGRRGWPVAASWFAVGGALGAAARPLSRPVLRHAAALAGVAGLLTAVDASSAGGVTRVAVLAVVSAALGVVALAPLRRRADWQRAVLWSGALLAVLAVALATSQPRAVFAAAVAALAAQSAVAGVALRLLTLQVVSPVLGCTAVLLLVSAAGQTRPYWYTVPIGLCLLVIVGLWRGDQRAAGRPVASSPIVTLEMVGVGMVVGASFVLAVTESVLHALLAAGLAVLVAAWGLGTRVRRRVATGATLVAAALVVLVVVPLVRLLPAWGSAAFWVLLVVVGAGVVVAATMLERTRSAIQASRARLGALLGDWE